MSLLASSPSEAAPASTGAEATRSSAAARLYDAFISYSHAKDKALASALQSAMQRLGKPWYRRRALRLFRDDTSLTATPHLWPSIEAALGQSRFLILMASPEAAASPWVDKEVATWLGRNDSDTVLIALSDGELPWDGAAGDFRWSEATPLPPALKGRFADEPRWIDLRPYREGASPRDARFTEQAADFAAALRGIPKEDLLSQEVRQQRRALRLAGSAVALLVVLLGLAGWQWTVARAQRNRAEHNLELATGTANDLIFEIVQKFRDLGVPAPVIKQILDQATKLQDQLTQGGQTSPDLRRSQAVALDETAHELLALGDTKGALAASQKARDILQSLLAAAPGNTYYQRDLSVSYENIGDVLRAQGDLAGALGAYRDFQAIIRVLAQKDPGNTEWQRGVSISANRIGDVLRAQGDLAGAFAAYRDSLSIQKALAQKDPGNTLWQEDLSADDDNIGGVLQAQGDFAGALAAYRDSQAITKALAQKNLGNTGWQDDLAASDERIGDVLQAQGDLIGALAAYRDGLAIIAALAQKDHDNTLWQRNLSASDENIGDVLRAQGDLAGALAAYRDSLAIIAALAQKDHDNTLWQRELSVSDNKIGDVLQAQGNLADALAIYRDSLAIRKSLAQKGPGNTQWQRDLAVSYTKIGLVAVQQNDLTGALDAFEQAEKIALRVKAANPTAATSASDLEWVQTRLAEIRQKIAAAGNGK